MQENPTEHNTWYTFGYRGIAFNLAFVVYLLALQPLVVEAAMEIFQNETKNVPFGVLLIVVIVLEAIMLPRKMRDVFARMDRDLPGLIFLLWVFHMIVSVILGIYASLAFGMAIDRSFLLPIIVLKELVLGTALIRPKEKPAPLSVQAALWVDLGLLVFSCIAYSIIWEVGGSNFTLHLPSAGWYELFGFFVLTPLIIFIMVLPIRLPFFAEEIAANQSRRGYINLVLSFVVLVVIALAPNIQTEPAPEEAQIPPPEEVGSRYEVAAAASTT